MLSPGMRQAAQISDTSQFDRIENKGKRMAASVNELKDRLEAVNKVRFSTTHEKEFDAATRAARRLELQIARLDGKGKTGIGIGGMLGLASVGYAAGSGIKESLGLSGEREKGLINMQVMTGNKDTGTKLLNEMTAFADVTPFESRDLITAGQVLLQFGMNAKQVMPTLKQLGDISGGDAEKLQQLTLAFGKVTAEGKMNGRELEEMIYAGFNPLTVIADKTGMKMADLRKAMEKGAIGVDIVKAAMDTATGPGGRFYQLMEKQSQTLPGMWSTFMDLVHHKLRSFGDLLSPIAKSLMGFGSALLAGEGPAIAIAVAIATVAAAIWGGTIATGAWSVAQAILNTVMAANPIILIIGLLIALGIWIYSLINKYEGWGNSMKGLWQIIKGFVNYNIAAWKNMGENIWYWIQFAWLKVESFVQWIGGAMMNVYNALKLAAQFKFTEAKAALTAEIKTSATSQLEELEKRHNAGVVKSEQEGMAALKQMQDGWKMVGLKKKATAGVDATTANASSNPDWKKAKGQLAEFDSNGKAEKINSGGQREIKVYITKQVGAENIYVMSSQEAAAQVEMLTREGMRRAILSLNGNSVSND